MMLTLAAHLKISQEVSRTHRCALDLMSTLDLCREPYTVAVLCIQKDQSTETAQVLSCYAGCKALG